MKIKLIHYVLNEVVITSTGMEEAEAYRQNIGSYIEHIVSFVKEELDATQMVDEAA